MADRTTPLHVALDGELTISTAAATRSNLLGALDSADEIEVDLGQVTEIDSAGIQLMIAAKCEAAARQKTLIFVGHSPAAIDTIDMTDLSAHFGDPMLIHSRN